MEQTRPIAAVGGATETDAVLQSVASYLLADLGPRPIRVEALERLIARHGLAIHRERLSGGISSLIWPKAGALIVSDDLSEAEYRWQLAHVLYHMILANAAVEGFACRETPEVAPICRRADHGAKFLLAGDSWFGGLERVEDAAEHFGVPVYQLVEAIRDRI